MSTRPATTPNYQQLSDAAFQSRVDELWRRYSACDLCAYECGVDHTAGDTGACHVDDTAYVSTYFDHHGEEDVLRGHNGSGTIFLAHCNMTCVFCQNFETSHGAQGEPATPAEIAEMALELQERGCHNVNFVSPTHHSPHLVEAVQIARDRGLDVPIVWNCGGYERPEILELLADVVDIYMPDVKWSDDTAAAQYSRAPGYWSNVTDSLREMHRQVGDLAIDAWGLATGGLLVRHLVMPAHVANAKDVLSFVAEEISRDTFVNVMAQYRPHYKAASEEGYDEINRRLTTDEYRAHVSPAISSKRSPEISCVYPHTGGISPYQSDTDEKGPATLTQGSAFRPSAFPSTDRRSSSDVRLRPSAGSIEAQRTGVRRQSHLAQVVRSEVDGGTKLRPSTVRHWSWPSVASGMR